ncbi:3-hydroxyacyl-CoA dehydrogenase [Streptomyces cinnamoneus]|uniref:3-hydroxyacyl-CoA dehydrogenase n=1 Tax=Streptomyces cinnamoneus TaxID=53446 RepID=A0A2G1XQ10_STRCJ|nr:3-hydroxyacyl-CoA dehydrogenase family protein [Streptomyces cinnamoneus]PHQ53229.1 3-hydroxyacyl-CoA dehydrogenase [Streptomyces cinnamoneus]PPT12321.1 3-hydroxyacyl-CoA dehydrogenase [Streptomyces cinnamoneus]
MTANSTAHRLTVLGAGVMGTNIATTTIGHGVPVVLVDIDPGSLEKARVNIARNLRHAQMMGALPAGRTPGKLITSLSPADGAEATAVVEAVTEAADLKYKVLAQISAAVRPGTPLITNTSGIPVDELAGAVERPGDVVGIHFMNPTYLIRLVEVVRGPRTAEATMEAVTDLLAAIERRAIVVSDSPGFVTSRLLHPMINDAARIVGEGVTTAESVDALMEGCLGHPTGPLRTGDLIGLDNLADSLWALHERTGNDSFRPCELLLDKVRSGDLGRKTGRGFFDYGEALS